MELDQKTVLPSEKGGAEAKNRKKINVPISLFLNPNLWNSLSIDHFFPGQIKYLNAIVYKEDVTLALLDESS